MATERETPPETGGGGLAGALARKYGPLPGWAWAGLAAAGALAWMWIRRRSGKADGSANEAGANQAATTDATTDDAGSIATLQSEILALQGEQAQHGGSTPTTGTTQPTTGTTQPTTGTSHPTTGPATGTHYVNVVVKPYTEPNPPWQSTLSGIAAHYHVAGGYQALAKLNHIPNPNLIHTGDVIKVPVAA